jgi:hypothetical protein
MPGRLHVLAQHGSVLKHIWNRFGRNVRFGRFSRDRPSATKIDNDVRTDAGPRHGGRRGNPGGGGRKGRGNDIGWPDLLSKQRW